MHLQKRDMTLKFPKALKHLLVPWLPERVRVSGLTALRFVTYHTEGFGWLLESWNRKGSRNLDVVGFLVGGFRFGLGSQFRISTCLSRNHLHGNLKPFAL